MRGILNGRRLVGLTIVLVLLYICWRGPERFWIESLGTWILSPGIYVRLLPQPFSNWLLTSLVKNTSVEIFLYIVPVFLFVIAFLFAVLSLWRNSTAHGLICLGIVGAVFAVYHYVQPFGITVAYF